MLSRVLPLRKTSNLNGVSKWLILLWVPLLSPRPRVCLVESCSIVTKFLLFIITVELLCRAPLSCYVGHNYRATHTGLSKALTNFENTCVSAVPVASASPRLP